MIDKIFTAQEAVEYIAQQNLTKCPCLVSPTGEYERGLISILTYGTPHEDRTGVGTISIFGHMMRFPLMPTPLDGDDPFSEQLPIFPLIGTKKVHLRSIIHELIWMLSGDTNIKYLKEHGVTIWDEWVDENGSIGPGYGKQWRDNNGVDQIKWVVDEIRRNPDSRRLLVSAWNPRDVPQMKLPPCHVQFQFYVRNGKLSCKMDIRSSDAFLGLPFNIAQYSLLTTMIAHCTNLVPHELVITMGDLHIYRNHLPQVVTQLGREPRPYPRIKISGKHEYPWEIKYEDIELIGYDPHPAIKGDVAT
jgi:thymidylate synthase